jgi:hypothetical protein
MSLSAGMAFEHLAWRHEILYFTRLQFARARVPFRMHFGIGFGIAPEEPHYIVFTLY